MPRDVNTREMARNVDRNECCVNFNREFWFYNFFEGWMSLWGYCIYMLVDNFNALATNVSTLIRFEVTHPIFYLSFSE